MVASDWTTKGKKSFPQVAASAGSGSGMGDWGVTASNEWYSVVSRNLMPSFQASSFTQRSLKVGRETAASNASLELRVPTNRLFIAPTTRLGIPVVITSSTTEQHFYISTYCPMFWHFSQGRIINSKTLPLETDPVDPISYAAQHSSYTERWSFFKSVRGLCSLSENAITVLGNV